MQREAIVYWTLLIAGTTLAAWWLAVRPGASLRDFATPAAFLTVMLAVLMCMLAVTNTPADAFFSGMYHLLACVR